MADNFCFDNEGTCSESVSFRIDKGRVRSVEFAGGCDGNLTGLVRLVEGMEALEVVRTLKGIPCGGKATSCPDQLAKAIEQALNDVAAREEKK